MSHDEEKFHELLDRILVQDAELFRRLALGPGVEDTERPEQAIVAEALAEADEKAPNHGTGWCTPSP